MMVIVLVPVVVTGLKVAVIPVRKPLADRVTPPVKPLSPVTVIVLPWLPPWGTLNLFGDIAKEKSGGGEIVKVNVVVWTRLPDVPVMVKGQVPALAQLAAVSVRMLLEVVVAGLNEAVTEEGRPLTVRVTAPLKPLILLTAIVLVPLLLAAMVTGFAAERE